MEVLVLLVCSLDTLSKRIGVKDEILQWFFGCILISPLLIYYFSNVIHLTAPNLSRLIYKLKCLNFLQANSGAR